MSSPQVETVTTGADKAKLAAAGLLVVGAVAALIGAVAGRSLEDDLRISLFAVGDDDQNIYAFAGASIDFIRRFEADYAAKPVWLIENYRTQFTKEINAGGIDALIASLALRNKSNAKPA